MLTLAALIPLFLSTVAPGGPTSPTRHGAMSHVALDLIKDLATWGRRFERRTKPASEDSAAALDRMLIELRGYARGSRRQRREAARALLDLYALAAHAQSSDDIPRSADGYALGDRAGDEFKAILDAELTAWLSQELLVLAAGNSVQRRAAAAELLSDSRDPTVLPALLICTRSVQPLLKEAAYQALAGWPVDSVHQLQLEVLRGDAQEAAAQLLSAAERHFRSVQLKPDDQALHELQAFVRSSIENEDWRVASRAASVSRALPNAQSVPLLIGALATWSARGEQGQPVRRLQFELTRELAARSGLELGLRADRWRTWWQAVERGEARPMVDRGTGQVTQPGFFGLRPASDRVVLVLDRSGSMAQPFAREGTPDDVEWTRHREVVTQMQTYLEGLGPDALFNVVVFGQRARSWRSQMQRATTANLRSVRSWALKYPPEGDTRLRLGLREALMMDPEGVPGAHSGEVDTLVILCDGRTTEGSDWIRPFLRKVLPHYRWIIHGVQIGQEGDGCLELLAGGTGGEFVRVSN